MPNRVISCYEVGREEECVVENIGRSWTRHFADEWKPPTNELVGWLVGWLVGVVKTILGSIENVRRPGTGSQSYLRHIEEFLTKKIGVSVKSSAEIMDQSRAAAGG